MIRLRAAFRRVLTLTDKRIAMLLASKFVNELLLIEAVENDAKGDGDLAKLLNTLDFLFEQVLIVRCAEDFDDAIGLVVNLKNIKSRCLYLGIVQSYISKAYLDYDDTCCIIDRPTFLGRIAELEQVFVCISEKID